MSRSDISGVYSIQIPELLFYDIVGAWMQLWFTPVIRTYLEYYSASQMTRAVVKFHVEGLCRT